MTTEDDYDDDAHAAADELLDSREALQVFWALDRLGWKVVTQVRWRSNKAASGTFRPFGMNRPRHGASRWSRWSCRSRPSGHHCVWSRGHEGRPCLTATDRPQPAPVRAVPAASASAYAV